MIKLQAVFQLPFSSISLANWFLHSGWFAELPFHELDETAEEAFLKVVNEEQRLTVREHVGQDRGHGNDAGLHTLWFEDKPVAIVKSHGFWEREHVTRWVTDSQGFQQLLGYLRSKMALPEPEAVSPDTEVFEEELFDINGHDFSGHFGFKIEPPAKGFLLMRTYRGVLPGLGEDMYLLEIHKDVKTLPHFVRRGACVLKFERPVSPEEHASNPLIRSTGENKGYNRHLLYKVVERPSGVDILAV